MISPAIRQKLSSVNDSACIEVNLTQHPIVRNADFGVVVNAITLPPVPRLKF